ncbi:probable rRNA maturation factor [Kytococcus aerolatus]|uniref:Endoribonuclease YbeY n=1 Tax=Kytococcus aerolatus TaxID=592308 RepID=A0A212U2P2_9MICO|nr:rRNA maturation RNase YbeY [Kytococcus aerolatus]SNC72394.1 probable rRNA maturation factor [Kytococcus aerolatus]
MTVEVLVEDDPRCEVEELVAAAEHALRAMHVHPQAELCLRIVDPAAIEVLHEEWMDLAGPTDVMSFPMDELRPGTPERPTEPGVLGDIVLCPAVAAQQAERLGHPVLDEMLVLTVHGVLHLLGYDHAEPDEEREMFTLQRDILADHLATLGRTTTAAPAPGSRGARG